MNTGCRAISKSNSPSAHPEIPDGNRQETFMTGDQVVILSILVGTILMFLWGRWRHDMVAACALLACVFTGLIPAGEAFGGFGHPAVITVACVLILSYGLQITGVVDALAQKVIPKSSSPAAGIAALCFLAALLSAFMNNVGALALLMPVGMQMASKHDLPPGKILMPLAFASILGGTMTLIGTPPNLIVSGFRAETSGKAFVMFDFAPVGAAIACIGVLFVVLIGWRLVPTRRQAATESFDTGTYLTEVRIPEEGKTAGKTLKEFETLIDEFDAQIVGMVRNDFRIIAPNPWRILKAGDIIVIESEPETLSAMLSNLGLQLEENVTDENGDVDEKPMPADPPPENEDEQKTKTDEFVIRELVVMPQSMLIGRSARDIQLRTRYGINLLAISRQGRRSIERLRSTTVKAGDVLLMQGAREALSGFSFEYGCVPLATRDIHVPQKKQALAAAIIMGFAIVLSALNILPAAVSFAAAVLIFLAVRIVPPRTAYQVVDWPVIVLLAAMLPVAGAMATTGAADLIARFLLETAAQGHAVVGLGLILAATMLMTDFMNNAATAAVMCPISISAAGHLHVNPDTFLMAVAIGASCAFLTPIGHQNNTLILGPGGFKFGDYWRMGLPTDILVIMVGLPMLLWIWPL